MYYLTRKSHCTYKELKRGSLVSSICESSLIAPIRNWNSVVMPRQARLACGLIAPIRNWNDNLIFSSEYNYLSHCTYKELKLSISADSAASKICLIAPIRNWNSAIRILLAAGVAGLIAPIRNWNQDFGGMYGAEETESHCTYKELKPIRYDPSSTTFSVSLHL